MANVERLLLITTVPPEHAAAVLDALGAAGAGVVGEYTDCAFISVGRGRFRAGDAAHPAYGERGTLNEVDEVRIETWVERGRARAVLTALRAAHPYEEPVCYLLPLLDEASL